MFPEVHRHVDGNGQLGLTLFALAVYLLVVGLPLALASRRKLPQDIGQDFTNQDGGER
jgi:hypothetical protein